MGGVGKEASATRREGQHAHAPGMSYQNEDGDTNDRVARYGTSRCARTLEWR
jgi:hypothetical protein